MTEPTNEDAEWLRHVAYGDPQMKARFNAIADRLATLTSEPSEAQIEAGAKTFCETESLNPRKLAKVVYLAMQRAGTSG